MIPYCVSVLIPNVGDQQSHEVKLFGTYADTDEEALRIVSDVMPDGWRVDRIAGLLSRFEVERLRLAYGDVCEVFFFTIGGLIIPEDCLYIGESGASPLAH